MLYALRIEKHRFYSCVLYEISQRKRLRQAVSLSLPPFPLCFCLMNQAVMHQDAPWYSISIHKHCPAFAASLKITVHIYAKESMQGGKLTSFLQFCHFSFNPNIKLQQKIHTKMEHLSSGRVLFSY